jgi:amidase
MIRIGRDKTFGAFDRAIPPVATVEPGQILCLETVDSHDGTIRSEANRYYTEKYRPNPATGPIAVVGAEPGDALSVEILEIAPGTQGYTTIRPSWGLITGVVERPEARILRVEGTEVLFGPGIRFPIRPMVGTIGVAPAGEAVSNMYAGPHGGNMDNNDVAPGATAFFPVFVRGGLFGLGDVHASMGDGELSGGGFDVPAEVTVKVGVRKSLALRWPRLEREGRIITTAAHADPVQTMRIAVEEMAAILQARLGLTRPDALMLLSVRGDVQVSTCHNHPQAGFTMRVSFPKLWAD